jgi:hypothetical protein
MSKLIQVPEEKLASLLQQIEELKKSEAEVVSLVKNICKAIGIAGEDGTIKPEIARGETNVIKLIAKVMGGYALDTFTPSGKKRLDEKFAFVVNIIPILEKYAK